MPRPVSKTQEIIECACGCGKQLLKYDGKWRSKRFINGHQGRGRKQTEEHIRKRASQMQGSDHPGWKGGKIIKHYPERNTSYIQIHRPNHPLATKKGYVLEHRLVMEKILGRYLESEEVVHHINKDGTDNREKNLVLFLENGDHLRDHFGRKENPIIYCACGCRQTLLKYDQYGRARKFIHGHNRRLKK